MYAVVKTGGKQFKLTENDIVRIEKIDAEVGTIVTLDNVMLVANDNDVTVGVPLVDGASVAIEILAQRRARKIVVFKKRRRKSSQTKNGHRQHFTLVRVSEVLVNGAKPTKEPQGMPEKFSAQIVENDVIIDNTVDAPQENAAEDKPKKTRAKKTPVEKVDASEDEAPKAAVKKAPAKKKTTKTKTESDDTQSENTDNTDTSDK